jgi:hypothetical protein
MSNNPVQPGLSPLPINVPVVDKQGLQTPVWQAWFNSIYTWCQGMGQSGTTGSRPTKGLFIGRQYFDTTLGYMVSVKQVSPSVIWVNGAGTPV